MSNTSSIFGGTMAPSTQYSVHSTAHNSSFAAEAKASALKSTNGPDKPELHKAFTDFVGQTFFGELLKQMRSSVGKPAYVHGGMGEDIFQSQLDQVLVERITDASAATFSDPMYHLLTARRP